MQKEGIDLSNYIEVRGFRIGKHLVNNISMDDDLSMLVFNSGDTKFLIPTKALPLLVEAIAKYINDKEMVK